MAGLAVLVAVGGAQLAASSSGASSKAAPQALPLHEVWRVRLTDGPHNGVALGSPSISTLPGGPAVVFGDRSGRVYALNLATGHALPGWPKDLGIQVTSTPSELSPPGATFDTVLVGSGNAAEPCGGGYEWLLPTGAHHFVQAPNPSADHVCAANGVFAGIAIGTLDGVTSAVAGTLGQETQAMNAVTRAVLPGFPWFQADSNFATPAIADVEGGGTNEIVEGGAQTGGLAFGKLYTQGGHIRILSATGNLLCQDTTDESVNSSPAVGNFLAGSAIGIVAGTGPTFPTASQHDEVIAVDAQCQQVWARRLAGTTGYESPALADVLGNGQLQVLVTTYGGGVYALDGANGATVWHAQLKHHIFGSPVTTELGTGKQIVVVGTINGFDVLTARDGQVLDATVITTTGFQNAPVITKDANGSIGITVAGYQPDNAIVEHFEIATSDGNNVDDPGTWPQFHHDPQLTGDASTPISMPFTAYTRISGNTSAATAAAELEQQFDAAKGHCPGTTASTRPVLLATDTTYPDALASAPLARSLSTGTLLTTPKALSPAVAAALVIEGITHVVVLGGPLAVTTAIVTKLAETPATTCGGRQKAGSNITVSRVAGTTEYETAAQVAAAAASGAGGVGSLDLAGAYAGKNATGGDGRFNDTAGSASSAPATSGALTTAVLATGTGFQDAEAADTLAYADRLPVLLTTATSLSPYAATAISSLHIAQVIVMGGPLAVSDSVVSALEAKGVSVLRVAGVDATDTAVQLARLETTAAPTGVGWHGTGALTVAQGASFGDGLAGAVVAADGPSSNDPEPLVLTENPTTIGAPLSDFLHKAGTQGIGGAVVTRFTILGGKLAIPRETVDHLAANL